MDTLRQLVEGLRSSTLTAPPAPLPTAAVQTSTPVDSLVLVPRAPSPSPVPASAGITSGTDAHIPDQQVPGHSPSHVPALLEGEGSSVVDPRPVDVPTDLLITLWCPTGDDPHSLRSANSGADEDYAPPPRPLQTDTFSDATMVVDTPTHPPPTIVVTSSDGSVEVAHAPGVNRRRSAHKTATHISVDLVIVLFRVDVTCHTSHVTVTRHNVCCI